MLLAFGAQNGSSPRNLRFARNFHERRKRDRDGECGMSPFAGLGSRAAGRDRSLVHALAVARGGRVRKEGHMLDVGEQYAAGGLGYRQPFRSRDRLFLGALGLGGERAGQTVDC